VPIRLGGSVGRGGQNDLDDVAVVSARLQELGFDPGNSIQDLAAAINEYQRDVLNFKHPDGRVDPRGPTEAALSAGQAAPGHPAQSGNGEITLPEITIVGTPDQPAPPAL
jgi:hypothetical protein